MTTQRVSREQILSLFRDAKLWAFASIAQQYLAKAPEDHAVRFAFAAALARLGLPGPARAHIAALPEGVRSDETVHALAQSLRDARDDEITRARREAFLANNLAALREHHPRAYAAIEPALAALRASLPPHADPTTAPDRWLRARDGNIVREWWPAPGDHGLPGGAGGNSPARLDGLADHAGFAREVVTVLTKRTDGPLPPVTIVGVNPPLLALEIERATRPSHGTGHAPELRIVETDAMRAAEALSMADLSALLAERRISLFVGASAIDDLASYLHERLSTKVVGPIASLPGVDASAVTACIQHIERVQNDEARRLRAGVHARDAARARGLAADRPLRVLIPTHLHSTFVRHASADIAHALRALGHEPHVLIEPSAHELLSGVAYLRALEEFDPDLIISINYPRSALWGLIPPNIPLVCWVQDAMPHLFSRELGASLGPSDFFVGHMHDEFFDSFDYPRDRTLRMPVLASTMKFHDGPVDLRLAGDLTCDLAHMGNQSETPEEVARQARERLASFPPALRALDEALPHVRAIAEDPLAHNAVRDVTRAAERALRAQLRRATDEPLDAALLTPLVRHALLPFADRVVRHQTLAWAAEIARTRGLSFHLYGRGWDRHPTLAPFARGTLDHAEPLRAAYQCARATLHASITTNLHQRVMECALSGGLPLCRAHASDVLQCMSAAFHAALRAGDAPATLPLPTADRPESCVRGMGYAANSSEHAKVAARAMHALFGHDPAWIACHDALFEAHRPQLGTFHERCSTAALLVDPARSCFATRAQLEHAALGLAREAAARRDLSTSIARVVRERFTYEAQMDHILSLVREVGAACRSAAA